MAGKIGKALGFEPPPMEEDMGMMESEEVEAPKESTGGAEVLAMKQFMRASTPEAKAQAMKDFMEACGCM